MPTIRSTQNFTLWNIQIHVWMENGQQHRHTIIIHILKCNVPHTLNFIYCVKIQSDCFGVGSRLSAWVQVKENPSKEIGNVWRVNNTRTHTTKNSDIKKACHTHTQIRAMAYIDEYFLFGMARANLYRQVCCPKNIISITANAVSFPINSNFQNTSSSLLHKDPESLKKSSLSLVNYQ